MRPRWVLFHSIPFQSCLFEIRAYTIVCALYVMVERRKNHRTFVLFISFRFLCCCRCVGKYVCAYVINVLLTPQKHYFKLCRCLLCKGNFFDDVKCGLFLCILDACVCAANLSDTPRWFYYTHLNLMSWLSKDKLTDQWWSAPLPTLLVTLYGHGILRSDRKTLAM